MAELKANRCGRKRNLLRPIAGHSLLDVCKILKVGNESEKITACRKRCKDCRKNGRGLQKEWARAGGDSIKLHN
jgi:hypothetical protein